MKDEQWVAAFTGTLQRGVLGKKSHVCQTISNIFLAGIKVLPESLYWACSLHEAIVIWDVSCFYCVAVLTLKLESDGMMSPLILTMLKITWYARKQGWSVILPVIFLWRAPGWNSMQHRGNIMPMFLFQSNFLVKGQCTLFQCCSYLCEYSLS